MQENTTEATENAPEDFNEWNLEPQTEYRFELEPVSPVSIKLVQGEAEIFGAEMALGHPYVFHSEIKSAIYSWQGCTLEVTGRPSAEYTSDETPMIPYTNVHLVAEQMRVRAYRASRGSPPLEGAADSEVGDRRQDIRPPRILVLGPENSGKTKLCTVLANLAIRSPAEWVPVIVNLDPNDGANTAPGTFSASPVNSTILATSPSNNLGTTATSAPASVTRQALLPLVYWFGFDEPQKSPALAQKRMRELAENVRSRFRSDALSSCSGLIIDTPARFASTSGGTTDQKYALLKHAVEAFDVNMIVVIGQERLYVEIQRLFSSYIPSSPITVIKVPKSGGVVELDHGYRERLHAHQLRTYFYGTPLVVPKGMKEADIGVSANTEAGDSALAPHSTVISFDDITIYRIGGGAMAPTSALPIGSAPVITETKPVHVDPSAPGSRLLNTVLAVLTPIPASTIIDPITGLQQRKPQGGPPSDEEILSRDVSGFIVIMALDIPHKKMTVLAPSPGSLSGRIAIAGSFEWQEQ